MEDPEQHFVTHLNNQIRSLVVFKFRNVPVGPLNVVVIPQTTRRICGAFSI